MPDIIAFDEAMKMAGGELSLLIGNGFSINYFSYANLLDKAELAEGGSERELFKLLDTADFERAVMALENAALVERAYKNEKQAAVFAADADTVRAALVKAVRATHPANRQDILDRIPICIALLKRFGTIFTLNYDLLLYWVTLDDTNAFKDGFGLGEEKDGFLGPFKPEAHCNVFNLHGGLHLFKTQIGDVEKRLMGANGVIEAIAETITRARRLPIYVAEGTSTANLARINSVPYLKHCYDKLGEQSGSLFVYGHGAKDNDAHIYDALFRSSLKHLFFCVHKPTAKIAEIDGDLSRYKKRNTSKIDYVFVDSQTVPVWPAK